jgi:hypothetical protein
VPVGLDGDVWESWLGIGYSYGLASETRRYHVRLKMAAKPVVTSDTVDIPIWISTCSSRSRV